MFMSGLRLAKKNRVWAPLNEKKSVYMYMDVIDYRNTGNRWHHMYSTEIVERFWRFYLH